MTPLCGQRTAGRESMVATPRAGRSRRLSPTPSPEPSQGPSQASLPMLNETLVMDGNDMEEEEELDQLDVLQSDDRPEEDELATAGDADEVDELEDEAAAAETTPQGPKLAKVRLQMWSRSSSTRLKYVP